MLQATGDAPYLVADGDALDADRRPAHRQPAAARRATSATARSRCTDDGRPRARATARSTVGGSRRRAHARCGSPTPAAARSCSATPATRPRTSPRRRRAPRRSAPRPTRCGSCSPRSTTGGATLDIDGDGKGASISDTMFGIFYEDINYAADGGLYAELVRNRSFEFNSSDNGSFTGMTAWSGRSTAAAPAPPPPSSTTPAGSTTMNRNYLTLTAAAAGDGVRNIGFNNGFAVAAGKTYDASVWARSTTAQDLTAPGRGHRRHRRARDRHRRRRRHQHLEEVRRHPDRHGHHRRRPARRAGGAPSTVALDMVSLMPQRHLGRPGQRPLGAPQGPRREGRRDEPGVPALPRAAASPTSARSGPTRRAATPTAGGPTSGRRRSARSRSARPTGTSGATTSPTASATWSTSSSPRTSAPSR